MNFTFLYDQKWLRENYSISDWAYTEDPNAISFDRYEAWVREQKSTCMPYITDQRSEKRKDIKLVYRDFESALIFLFPYHQSVSFLKKQQNEKRLAYYTFAFGGEDYHQVMKKYLKEIAQKIAEKTANLEFIFSIDILPVLERDLAYRSGLGWFGKNSMLLNREQGSYFLIGSIFFNQKLKLDYKQKPLSLDHCGECNLCLEACPTSAINGVSRTIDLDKCVTTFTVEENRDVLPTYEYQGSEVFGCDICQDVCPWNVKTLKIFENSANWSEHYQQKYFTSSRFKKKLFNFWHQENREMIYQTLKSIPRGEFRRLFRGTSFFRSRKTGLLKNIFAFKKRLHERENMD